MPEVITDTSPIQYLYQINQLNLLPTLYEQVKMPPAVADELAQGHAQGISVSKQGMNTVMQTSVGNFTFLQSYPLLR